MDKDNRKNRFVESFGIVVVVLALVRCVFPGVDGRQNTAVAATEADTTVNQKLTEWQKPVLLANGERPHRIFSVPSYDRAFPDSNHVQLVAAQRWGVKPVKDRDDAERRKSELVYMGLSPYYFVDPLYSSIPYLVPRAAIVLQDIGQAFFDSLQVKGIPLHRFIVTSVLRTESDVVKLRRHNGNATEHSCHLYGTTFDICYNRYNTVEDPDGPQRQCHGLPGRGH